MLHFIYVSILYFRSFLVYTPPAMFKNTIARPSGRVRLAGAASARHRAFRILTNTALFVTLVVDVSTPHSPRNRICDTPTRLLRKNPRPSRRCHRYPNPVWLPESRRRRREILAVTMSTRNSVEFLLKWFGIDSVTLRYKSNTIGS